MADTLDLGSSAERRGGSSPFIRTIKQYIVVDFAIWHNILCLSSPLRGLFFYPKTKVSSI